MLKYILNTIFLIAFVCLTTWAQNRLIPASGGAHTILPEMLGFNNQMASVNEPWNDFNRKQALKKSRMGLLRYPGGTVSNYWDMEFNRLFKNSTEIDTSNTLPRVHLQTKNVIGWVVPMYAATNSIANLKQAYQTMSDSHVAEPAIVFVLNMITPGADYYTQKWKKPINETPLSDDWWAMMNDRLRRNIKMLDEVRSNGMKVKYIEFGNEFFFGQSSAGEGKNGGAIVEPYSAGAFNTGFKGAFPGSGKSYADAVNNWADILSKRYPNVRLCAIGADANGTLPSRRNSWNKEVVKYIDKNLVPAISLHVYNGVTSGNLISTEENLGKAFASWKHHWEWIKKYSSLPFDREFWFTEYNPNKDKKTWGHGLLNLYIVNTWMLEGNLGLSNYHQFAQNSHSGSNLFASTRVFAMLAQASRGNTSARQLQPINDIFIKGSGADEISSLIAWQFSNETASGFTYFLSNLSSQEINLDLSYIAEAHGAFYYSAKSSLASTNDPGEKFGILSNTFKIPPFSCIYFKAGDISPVSVKKIPNPEKAAVKIYPNPGKIAHIYYSETRENTKVFQLNVSDITRKSIFTKTAGLLQIEKDISAVSQHWENGIYLLNFKSADENFCLKWIKN